MCTAHCHIHSQPKRTEAAVKNRQTPWRTFLTTRCAAALRRMCQSCLDLPGLSFSAKTELRSVTSSQHVNIISNESQQTSVNQLFARVLAALHTNIAKLVVNYFLCASTLSAHTKCNTVTATASICPSCAGIMLELPNRPSSNCQQCRMVA